MTVDFLIQPSFAGDKGGTLRSIEPDFAAIIAPGSRCAFRDRQAAFLIGGRDEELQADVVGFVSRLVDDLEKR